MSAEGELLPILIILSMIRRTKTTGKGQELPPTNLFYMKKITAMDAETTIHLREAW